MIMQKIQFDSQTCLCTVCTVEKKTSLLRLRVMAADEKISFLSVIFLFVWTFVDKFIQISYLIKGPKPANISFPVFLLKYMVT